MSKNISVFGLYPTESAVAEGVDQLRLAGFRNTTFRFSSLKTQVTKTWLTKGTQRRLKALRPARDLEPCSAERSAGSPESDCWLFPDLAHS